MLLDFVEMLKVIFLGIVEGITEWLPISSTGHMILLNEIVSLDVSDEFRGDTVGSYSCGSAFVLEENVPVPV